MKGTVMIKINNILSQLLIIQIIKINMEDNIVWKQNKNSCII